MNKFLRISPQDNVLVALDSAVKGEAVVLKDVTLCLADNIFRGHKVALRDIKKGEDIIKYGFPIGSATKDIAKGEHVHVYNTKTNLSGVLEYNYNPVKYPVDNFAIGRTFEGYLRKNGDAAVRNEIWIVPTVGCVNEVGRKIRAKANEMLKYIDFDGVQLFEHPYGCSQMGDDQETTKKILADLVLHPNAGAVLVLGLGCENNTVSGFKELLGDFDKERIRFLVAQDVADEVQASLEIIAELGEIVKNDKRQPLSISKLNIGLKCGGSDGLSGITGNPLLGVFSDLLTGAGGTTVLTEVPEMFGAETVLMDRAESEQVFEKTVDMINGFKDYYARHNQVIYENPSPGNKDGGITTLEDKSLGCVQKGGTAAVVDVLKYGEVLTKPGLNLLEGPGNDIVAVTVLAAAKCHITLFTTGRGTPLGSPVPVIKVATNSALAKNKHNWVDFNAGVIAEGADLYECGKDFFYYVIDVASGKIKTKNEVNDYRDMAIFKNGVTL